MKAKFIYLIVFVLFLINSKRVLAQIAISESSVALQFNDGRIATIATDMNNSKIDGTPYLTDEWSKGVVNLADGRTYKDVTLKYDLLKDVLYFQNDKKQVLTFVKPVSEFVINYIGDDQEQVKHYKSGFANIQGYTAQNFFEVLVEGKAQLLKKQHKFIESESGAGLGPTTQKYSSTDMYYIVMDGKASAIKRDKKSVLQFLGDKQNELSAYIKSNDLDMKKDADLAKVIIYYNSI